MKGNSQHFMFPKNSLKSMSRLKFFDVGQLPFDSADEISPIQLIWISTMDLVF